MSVSGVEVGVSPMTWERKRRVPSPPAARAGDGRECVEVKGASASERATRTTRSNLSPHQNYPLSSSARGVHYLHSSKPPILHRDLKTQNVLVGADWSVRLCDFGLARDKHRTFLSNDQASLETVKA